MPAGSAGPGCTLQARSPRPTARGALAIGSNWTNRASLAGGYDRAVSTPTLSLASRERINIASGSVSNGTNSSSIARPSETTARLISQSGITALIAGASNNAIARLSRAHVPRTDRAFNSRPDYGRISRSIEICGRAIGGHAGIFSLQVRSTLRVDRRLADGRHRLCDDSLLRALLTWSQSRFAGSLVATRNGCGSRRPNRRRDGGTLDGPSQFRGLRDGRT